MVLYMIGLGLGDENDVTLKGMEMIQKADLVVLEAYTSILTGMDYKDRLEEKYGKPVLVADRNMVESEAEEKILIPDKNVAFLVVGDPLCATTHTDLWLRAKEAGIPVEIVHNASIMGAAASCGLSLYKFGQTVSIPFFEDNWKPTSYIPKMEYNLGGGMHTLCLLDIKVKEPDFQAMMKGQTKYLPPRFMSASCAAQQLLEATEMTKVNDGDDDENDQEESAAPPPEKLYPNALYPKALCIGLARMGQETQQIMAGTLEEMAKVDMGGPLHSLIVCGDLEEYEMEMLKQFLIQGSSYQWQEPNKP